MKQKKKIKFLVFAFLFAVTVGVGIFLIIFFTKKEKVSPQLFSCSGNHEICQFSKLDAFNSEFMDKIIDDPDFIDQVEDKVMNFLIWNIIKKPEFNRDLQAIEKEVDAFIKNEKLSLEKSYGSKWKSEWKEKLKNEANESEDYYRLLEIIKKAKNLLINFYVNENEKDFLYYDDEELNIKLHLILGDNKNDSWNKGVNKSLFDVDLAYHAIYGYNKSIDIKSESAKNKITEFWDKKNQDVDYSKKKFWVDALRDYQRIDEGNLGLLVVGHDFSVIKKNESNLTNLLTSMRSIDKQVKGVLTERQARILKIFYGNTMPLNAQQIVIPYGGNSNEREEFGKAKLSSLELLEKFAKNSFAIETRKDLTKFLSKFKENISFSLIMQEIYNKKNNDIVDDTQTGNLGLIMADNNFSNIFKYNIYNYALSRSYVNRLKNATDVHSKYNFNKITFQNENDENTKKINEALTDNKDGNDDQKNIRLIKILLNQINYSENNVSLVIEGNKYNLLVFLDQKGIHFVNLLGEKYLGKTKNSIDETINLEQRLNNGHYRSEENENKLRKRLSKSNYHLLEKDKPYEHLVSLVNDDQFYLYKDNKEDPPILDLQKKIYDYVNKWKLFLFYLDKENNGIDSSEYKNLTWIDQPIIKKIKIAFEHSIRVREQIFPLTDLIRKINSDLPEGIKNEFKNYENREMIFNEKYINDFKNRFSLMRTDIESRLTWPMNKIKENE